MNVTVTKSVTLNYLEYNSTQLIEFSVVSGFTYTLKTTVLIQKHLFYNINEI